MMWPLADISTGQVIKEIHKRPVLWHVSSRSKKGCKPERDLAWEEVCTTLVPEYKTLTAIERIDLEKAIQQRWKTARDAYIRCKSGIKAGTVKKRYYYFERLKFLEEAQNEDYSFVSEGSVSSPAMQQSTNNSQDNDTDVDNSNLNNSDPLENTGSNDAPNTDATGIKLELCSIDDMEEGEHSEIQEDFTSEPEYDPETLRKRRKLSTTNMNKQQTLSEDNSQRPNQIDSQNQPSQNDNMAFFTSMLPIVDKFSDRQKLLFRSEVLRIALELTENANSVGVN